MSKRLLSLMLAAAMLTSGFGVVTAEDDAIEEIVVVEEATTESKIEPEQEAEPEKIEEYEPEDELVEVIVYESEDESGEESMDEAEEKPVEITVDEPVEKPAEKPTEKTAEEITEKSSSELVEDITDKLSSELVEDITDMLAAEFAEDMTDELTAAGESKSVNDLTIEAIAEQDWTGSAIEPTVKVMDGTTQLEAGEDYSVTYSNNVDAGTATATIKGLGNYKDSRDVNFNIKGTSIENATVTLDSESVIYDGNTHKPVVTSVKLDETTLNASDYEVKYYRGAVELDAESGDFTTTGDITVKVSGKGKYEGTAEKTFTIQYVSIKDAVVTLSTEASVEYDAKQHKPTVTSVKLGDKELTANDYEVKYYRGEQEIVDDDISASGITPFSASGTYTVKVNGINGYGDTVEKTFTITKNDISKWDIKWTWGDTGNSSITFDNAAHSFTSNIESVAAAKGFGDAMITYDLNPTITLTYTAPGSTTAVDLGDALTVTSAGTYTLTITADEDSWNFTGSKAASITINPYDISTNSSLALNQSSFVYDGAAKTSDAKLTAPFSASLVAGTDFTLTGDDLTGVGNHTVTITGQGNYTGSKTAQIAIKKSLNHADISVRCYSAAYAGHALTPVITVMDGDKKLTENTDYYVTCATAEMMDTGNYTVFVNGMGLYGVDGDTPVETTFTITGTSIADADVTLQKDSATYNGQQQVPSVQSVKLGNMTLTEDDYEVKYYRGTQEVKPGSGDMYSAGDITVKVNGKGAFDGTVVKTFTISQVDISDWDIQYTWDNTGKTSIIYDEASHNLTTNLYTIYAGSGFLIDSRDENLSLSFKFTRFGTSTVVDQTTMKGKFAGTYVMTVSGKEPNFKGTKAITLTIEPIDLSKVVIKLESTETTYNNQIQMAFLDSITLNNVDMMDKANYLKTYRDYGTDKQRIVEKPEDYIDASVTTFEFKITGDSNYTGKATVEYTIKPYDISENETFELDKTVFAYNGSAITSDAKITTPFSATLEAGKDFTITGDDLISLGNHTVTITGQGNYTGTRTAEITIKKSLNHADISVTCSSATYTGEALTPIITVKDGDKELKENTDYTVTYATAEMKDAGDYGVTVTGIGNYAVDGDTPVQKTFTIEPQSLDNLVINLESDGTVYDGQMHDPKITSLMLDGVDCTKKYAGLLACYRNYGTAEQYKLTSDNDFVDAGIITIVAEGQDNPNYTGKATAEYVIEPYSLDNIIITLDSKSATYDGKPHVPTIVSITQNDVDRYSDFIDGVYRFRNYGTAKQTELKAESDYVEAGVITFAIDSSVINAYSGKNNFVGKSYVTFTISEKDEEEEETAAEAKVALSVNPVVNAKALWGFVDDKTASVAVTVSHADGTKEIVPTDDIILAPEGFFYAAVEPLQKGDTITISLTDDEGNTASTTISVTDTLPPAVATALGANISGEVDNAFAHSFAMPVDLTQMQDGQSVTVPLLIYDTIEIGTLTLTLNGGKLDISCELNPGAEKLLPEDAKFYFSSYDAMPTIDALRNDAHTAVDAQAQGTTVSIDVSNANGTVWLYVGIDCAMDAQTLVNALSGEMNFYIWAEQNGDTEVSPTQEQAYAQYKNFCDKAE